MAINLLPPKFQPKPILSWKRLGKMLLISTTVFALIFAGQAYYFYRKSLNDRLVNLQTNITNLSPVFEKVKNFEETVAQVKKIEEISQKIGKAKQVWSEILADIAGSLGRDIWFVQISKEEDQVIIQGEAKNFSTVGEFAVKIRGLQWFENVDVDNVEKITQDISGLKRSGSRITLTENARFSITAKLKNNIKLFVPPKDKGGEQK